MPHESPPPESYDALSLVAATAATEFAASRQHGGNSTGVLSGRAGAVDSASSLLLVTASVTAEQRNGPLSEVSQEFAGSFVLPKLDVADIVGVIASQGVSQGRLDQIGVGGQSDR